MNENIYLGVDGGGTKTICIAVNHEKKQIGKATSGSTNQNSVGAEVAQQNLFQCINECLKQANTTADHVISICLCMSGVDRPSDKAMIKNWLSTILKPSTHIMIENDAVAALVSGTMGHLYGIVVICGTGMIAVGYDKDGKSNRAGGWGPLLGDKGSGYDIGQMVLQAATMSHDKTAPATTLLQAVLDHLNLVNPSDIIGWAYKDTVWERFAKLAPLAFEHAQKGDEVAKRIVNDAALALGNVVITVAKTLSLQNATFPLVFAGGNLAGNPMLRQRLRNELVKVLPNAQFIEITDTEAALGAALYSHKVYLK